MNYRYVVLNSSGQAARAEDWSCPSDVAAEEPSLKLPSPYGADLGRAERMLRVIPPRLALMPT